MKGYSDAQLWVMGGAWENRRERDNDCDDSEPEIDPKAVCPWSLDIEEDCDDE